MTIVTTKTNWIDLLDDLAEFLDGYVDVNDGEDGTPRPNKAMELLSRVEVALCELEDIE